MKANGKSWASVVRLATRTELHQMWHTACDLAGKASTEVAKERFRNRARDCDAEVRRRDAAADAAAERAMRAEGGT